jgi:hypothetical protein
MFLRREEDARCCSWVMTGTRTIMMSRSVMSMVDGWPRSSSRKGSPAGRVARVDADHLPEDADPADVVIRIETDCGPWVQALIAAGYTVYAPNPLQAARYRVRQRCQIR